jgi:hypothetical protein
MLQLRISPHEDVLVAQVAGLVSLPAWEKLLRELDAALEAGQGDRLVINLTELVGWLGVPERTQVGALMAAHLRRMTKVALYIQPEKITGVVQAEAERHGLALRLFSEFDSAVSWARS